VLGECVVFLVDSLVVLRLIVLSVVCSSTLFPRKFILMEVNGHII
jgi:hypothetical protein